MVRTVTAMQNIPYKGQINSPAHNTNYSSLYSVLIAGMDFPIGGVIPIFLNMTGCPTPSAADGWAACNGTTAASQGVPSPTITGTLPNINSGAFIRGNTTSWSTGSASGGADTHTHTSAAHAHTMKNHTHNLPNHIHTMGNHTHTISNHVHTNSGTTGTGSAHTHGTGALYASIGYNNDHSLTWQGTLGSGTGLKISGTTVGGSATQERVTSLEGSLSNESSHTHSYSTNTGNPTTNPASGAPSSNNTDNPTTNPASGVPSDNTSDSATPGDTGSSSTLPVYFSAVYYMRTK